MNNTKYYLAAIAAFTIWGFFSLVLKPLSNYNALEILLYRAIVSASIMLIVSSLFRVKTFTKNVTLFKSFTKKHRQKLVLINIASAILLAANWYLFIWVMNTISVNATSLAYLICPIITTVLAYFILKEKLSNVQWIAVLISLISCILLALGNLMNLLYSLIIAIVYALYLVLQRKNNQLDKFLTLSLQIALSALLILPLYPMYKFNSMKTDLFYILILLIATLFTVVPMFLNVYALKNLNSSVVGIFIYLNPIFSFLLAIFYFKENINIIQYFAYSMILFSIILFNIKVIKKLTAM